MKTFFAVICIIAMATGCGPSSADVQNSATSKTDSLPDSLKAAADSSNARVKRSIDSLDSHVEEVFEKRDTL